MSNIIQFTKPKQVCSFCRKPKDNIKMSQNSGTEHEIHICADCAKHAKERMNEHGQ